MFPFHTLEDISDIVRISDEKRLERPIYVVSRTDVDSITEASVALVASPPRSVIQKVTSPSSDMSRYSSWRVRSTLAVLTERVVIAPDARNALIVEGTGEGVLEREGARVQFNAPSRAVNVRSTSSSVL